MKHYKSLAALGLMTLLLAACGSSGMGDILGGGSSPQTSNYEIRGTIDSVDLNSRSIYLTNVSGYQSMLSNGGGNAVRVYFDDQTAVNYQGQTYRPEDLERGDQVTVRVDESGNRLVANAMTVTYDATASGSTSGSGNNGTYGSTVRGVVANVDTGRRTIELDRGGYGTRTVVEYNNNTPVTYNGRSYRPVDLERGDEVEIRVSDYGNGRLVANDIMVTLSAGGGSTGLPNSSSSTRASTIRGTVSYVDTSRRTIELESASWIRGFTTGGASGNRITVQYDPNASIDVQGRQYPISGLERGDVIEVEVSNASSTTPFANRIYLVRDINQR